MGTRQAYWDDVRDTVADAIKEFTEEMERDPEAYDVDGGFEFITEWIDTATDGTAIDCEDVMQHTDNPDAIHDVGEDFDGKSWREVCEMFASWAWRQDHRDHMPSHAEIESIIDAAQPSDDDDDDDDDDDEDEEEVEIKTGFKPGPGTGRTPSRAAPASDEPEEEPALDKLRKFFAGPKRRR